MRLFDQHLHSRHSFDSRAEPADNVRTAIERGLAGLIFTEHFDTHPEDWLTSAYDHAKYSATIDALRSEFGDRLFIGKGIEVDYQPDGVDGIVDFLDGGDFDMVMLSVHWSEDQPIHKQSAWVDRDPSEVTRAYLETVLAAVLDCERLSVGRKRVFDCLGHLDFCKRYSHRFRGATHVDEHMDVIGKILRACLDADLIPEVNTSTWRRGFDEPMPGPGVVRRYAELGGEMMSLGSDSHAARDIGADFDKGLAMLSDCGIGHVALFESRARTTEAIDSANRL